MKNYQHAEVKVHWKSNKMKGQPKMQVIFRQPMKKYQHAEVKVHWKSHDIRPGTSTENETKWVHQKIQL